MRATACRVAVVQAGAVRGRPDVNVQRALDFVARAARRGASLVVFPEMYLTGYAVWRSLSRLGLGPQAPEVRTLARAAGHHGVGIIVGAPERGADGLYNAALVIGADGRPRPPYRKVHLFAREREYFRSGRGYRLYRLAGLTVGVLICYDVEFPEAARALALGGADLVAVSSANMEPYRGAQDVYIRARAMENQVFVALANRVGAEDGLRFVGGSGIWDPGGRTLAAADRDEALLVARVDPAVRRRERRRFDYLVERRPDTYGPLRRTRRGGRAAGARPTA